MRRFVRGLGTGILLTTLILTVAYYSIGKRELTDSEVIVRAKKLGMIQSTEQPLFSNDASEESLSVEQTSQEAGNLEQPVSDAAVQNSLPQENALQENVPQQSVSLVINGGDGATVVAQRLKDIGVITDAADFDNYLRTHSHSRSLQVGTYELTPGMSYEEITSKISSKQ